MSFLPCSLKELDLSFCKILDGVIPQDLQGLRQMEDLKLCGNDFTSLPASIGSLPKLGALSLDDCRWLRSIPQLQSSVDYLHVNRCPSMVSIDLTNFRGDAELELNGCLSLKEIEGYFNMEPLDVEIVEKLLRSNSSSMKDLITNTNVRKIDNLTKTNKICPLQTLSERGIYNIFFPGSEIPTWFNHQSEGNTVSLRVPFLNSGFRIIGIVTSAIYAWRSSSESCYFSPHITIANNTKMFEWIYNPYTIFLSSEIEQDMNWLCYWIFNDIKDENEDVDMSWRFKTEMDEGDEVEFSIDVGFGINVKRCGIHLLFQPIDLSSQRDDLAMISYAASRHHRRFLHSRPRLLTVKSIEEVTSKEVVAPPKNEEFVQ